MNNKNTIPIIHNCTITSQDTNMLLVDHLSHYIDSHQNMIFPHKHNFYHFVLFTKGTGNHLIDFENYPIQTNQLYFMAPGQVHTWNFAGDEEGFVVNFDQEYFQSFLLRTDYIHQFSFLSGNLEDAVFNIPQEYVQKTYSAFELLYETNKTSKTKDLTRVCLLHLLLYIDSWHGKKLEKSLNPYHRTIFQNYQILVEQNFKEIRLPKDYAAQLFITANHLNAICKAYIGISAGEIIRKRILLEAKRLLINKGFNINEVSNALKFKDNSYFTKFFKRCTGVTPEEFRKNNS